MLSACTNPRSFPVAPFIRLVSVLILAINMTPAPTAKNSLLRPPASYMRFLLPVCIALIRATGMFSSESRFSFDESASAFIAKICGACLNSVCSSAGKLAIGHFTENFKVSKKIICCRQTRSEPSNGIAKLDDNGIMTHLMLRNRQYNGLVKLTMKHESSLDINRSLVSIFWHKH